jgi:hypothetical protein
VQWARERASPAGLELRGADPLVLAVDGRSAPAAALLAGALGYDLLLCRGRFVEDVVAVIRRERRGAVIVVATCAEATDELLMGLAQETLAALESDVAWERLPRVTLLSGRDLASLSWVVAKAIVGARRAAGAAEPRPFAHYATDGQAIVARHLTGGGASARRLDGKALLTALASTFTAVAYQTHGVDSCAQGGDGVVLCGLRAEPAAHPISAPGILACARGHACPRGPHPFALSRLRADVFFLASCNGLRLADSTLDADFNLGLSFLDGIGHAYVSTITAGFGSELASLCFMAALADGRALADAILLANAGVHAAGLDAPSYIAVGMPELRVAPAPTDGGQAVRELAGPVEGRTVLDFGGRHLGEVLVDAPALVALTRARRLALSVTAGGDDPVHWFGRVERRPGAAGATPDQAVLRLVLFRFPEPLGALDIAIEDGARLRRRARGALDGVRRWVDVIRSTVPSEPSETITAALRESEEALRTALTPRLKALDFDGSAHTRLRPLLERAESLAVLARDVTLNELTPGLTGPFWLTNSLARDYHLARGEPTTCPNCGGHALRKLLRHQFHADGRDVIVCLRCLIASDVRHRGDVRTVTLAVPDFVAAGTAMTAVVRITGRAGGDADVRVCPRITERGGISVVPEPSEATCRLGARARTLAFRFGLPRGLMPHQYQIKVLAASSRDIAFAQRPFFVTPPT